MEKTFVFFNAPEESDPIYIDVNEIEAFMDNRIYTKGNGRYKVSDSRDEILKKLMEVNHVTG